MTDPVTNVEIEDVLSSIRRLVSENGRGAATRPAERSGAEGPVEQVEEPSEGGGQDDMLVLTPALRVSEPEPETAPAPENAATDNDPSSAEALESVVKDALGEALAKMARPQAGSESGSGGAAGDDLGSRASGAGESLKERIAELETVVAQQEGDWEPDGDSEDAYAGTPVETLAWEDHVEEAEDSTDAPEHVWSEDRIGEVEEAELVELDENDVGAAPEPIFAHAAEPAAAFQETVEEEQSGSLEDAGLDTDPADAQGVADAEEFDAPEDTEAMDEDVDLFGADETLIDEEVLREMVADIVRQELQGTLGERITRNVRKLVRREIHRALAAHELD